LSATEVAADGRRRLQALEQKLNQLKTHQSRMEQHLATRRRCWPWRPIPPRWRNR